MAFCLCACLELGIQPISVIAQKNRPTVVKTATGRVQGFDQEGTTAFLGIPYAKVERFMPPQPVEPWDTVMVCNHWGPQAMQPTPGRTLSEAQMSEQHSCVLNVWTTNVRKAKPVMLWLHGGGFDSGTSEWDPGMQLAKKDVVVVSINHRLNILGFCDLSALSPRYKYSGNVGMLDVVQALQWIQTNIRRFGGDPDNVTVFGESGGGGKVGTLLCMPQAKGLFHKAIIMSGTILNVNTKAMTEELGKAVVNELGIDPSHLEQLNDVPYEQLYAAGQRAMAASIGTRKPGTPMMWGFGPTPDGEVLLQQPFQNGFSGISNDIPILIGTTFNELQRLRYNEPMTQDEARRELFQTFGFDTDKYITAFGKAWPDYQPQDLLCIDWLFRPKTLITADEIAQTRHAKTWMYLFTWRSPSSHGSVHGHELKFCFNRLPPTIDGVPVTSLPTARRLADTMSSVWAQFARTGNPNIPTLPQWQNYTPQNGELMVFGDSCYLRNNPDRELQQIIDKHCFLQLDEFRQDQKRIVLQVGDASMKIDADHGGKIMSLKYKNKEVISQSRRPEAFGSTFWTSPQKEWNWPPVPEFDKQAYSVEQRDGSLILTSGLSENMGYRIRKTFATDVADNAFVITYSIINESNETRQVAPWEITRVPNEGIISFDAPLSGITPAGLLDFHEGDGAVWYEADEANENRKVNADGKGWLAYQHDGLVLVKTFADLTSDQPAPGEAEIQIYVNRGKTYIELESQGAYTTLQPHEELNWTVKWYLLPADQIGNRFSFSTALRLQK